MRETIRLINLTTGYNLPKGGRKEISRDLNAALHSGELTCLLGQNGAGKSTLLRTLSGFLPPLSGEILIEDKPLGSYTAPELAKVAGVVLTERIAVNNMTVTELVGMGRSPYTGFWGRLTAADKRIVNGAMETVGIMDLRNRMMQTLSDGERQKVMIAKALAQETAIIFLDEPTAFLDYPSKVDLMQLLRKLASDCDKTIFLSTHDLELALQIADRVWLLSKHHGMESGVPEDLALSGAMEKFFSRRGVGFDRVSGLFRILSDPSGVIAVEGEGIRAAMVRKALGRIGLQTSGHTDDEAKVTVTDAAFKFRGHDHHSISCLLDDVREWLAQRNV